jgi:hypothetical protein
MGAKSSFFRFVVVIGILLILLVGGLVILWELTWSTPEAPVSKPLAVSTTQSQLAAPAAVSGTIGGVIQDEAKNPIRGAKVRVEWNERAGTADAHSIFHNKSVTTNDQGKWTLAGVKTNSLIGVSLTLSHRDYAQKQIYDVPLAQVTDHSYVTILSHGIDLAGQVVNSAGAAIANATVTTKRTRYDNRGQTVRSDADGQFALHHIDGYELTLIVTAADYAPQFLRPAPTQPVKVVMTSGQTVQGRVVDPKGVPIKGVQVALRRWANAYEAVDMHATTDADGKFQLAHIPAESIDLNAGKQGYQDAEVTYNPGDPALTITLPPTVIFSGKVVDADTGKPIPTFYAFCGAHWPGWSYPIFNLDVHPENTFHDGNYKLPGSGFGGTILAWQVRIEADGYFPQIGNAVTDGGNAPQDFQLHRGPDLHGTLVDADGKPVPNIPIVRLLPCSSTNFTNGEYDGSSFGTGETTDAQGAFRFRPQAGPFELWAITKTGVAQLQQNGSNDAPVTLKLRPFASARVHLSSMPSGSDQTVNLGITPGREPEDPLNFSHWGNNAPLQPGGYAVFNRLPVVGDGLASAYVYFGNSQNRSVVMQLSPGKTTDIDLTGGVTVTGQVVRENSTDSNSLQQSSIDLQRLPDGPPVQWPAGWAAAARERPLFYGYYGLLGADGKFSIPGVEPGKYEFESFAQYGSSNVVVGTVSVPKSSGDHPTFDMGSIRYQKVKPLSIGDSAPPVLGKTLADEPVRLSSFAGKCVILVFWGTTFGGMRADDPAIAAFESQFGNDKRVALVAINEDRAWGNSVPPDRPASLPGAAWTSGYVSIMDVPMLTELSFFGAYTMPRLYLISPDGKLAAMDSDGRKITATLQQLLTGQH